MVYIVGSVVSVRKSGIVVDAGEGKRCNIYIAYQDNGQNFDVQVGARVRAMCAVRWKKKEDHEQEATFYTLEFTALDILKK